MASKNNHQILTSKDRRISIEITENLCDSIFPASDFSLLNIPVDIVKARDIYQKLYTTQRNNHCCLTLAQHPRKERLQALVYTLEAEQVGFKFHDFISLVYHGPYKSIPKNLTPLSEIGVLFTKYYDVNKQASAWFRPDIGDCANIWDLDLTEGEKAISSTTSRHFCLELGHLMASLASPLVCRRFLVLQSPEKSHVEFAAVRNMNMYCVTDDISAARRVLKFYNSKIIKEVL